MAPRPENKNNQNVTHHTTPAVDVASKHTTPVQAERHEPMSLPVGSPTHSSRPEVANTYPAPFQAHRDEVHDSIYPSAHCADQRDRHTCPPPRHCTHPKPRIALQLTRALRTGAVEPWPTSQQGPAQVARRRPGLCLTTAAEIKLPPATCARKVNFPHAAPHACGSKNPKDLPPTPADRRLHT